MAEYTANKEIAILMHEVSSISIAATKQALKEPASRPDTQSLEELRHRLLALKTKVVQREKNPDAPADKYQLDQDPQLFFALKSLFKNNESMRERSFDLAMHCLGAASSQVKELIGAKAEEADVAMAAIADLAARQSYSRYK